MELRHSTQESHSRNGSHSWRTMTPSTTRTRACANSLSTARLPSSLAPCTKMEATDKKPSTTPNLTASGIRRPRSPWPVDGRPKEDPGSTATLAALIATPRDPACQPGASADDDSGDVAPSATHHDIISLQDIYGPERKACNWLSARIDPPSYGRELAKAARFSARQLIRNNIVALHHDNAADTTAEVSLLFEDAGLAAATVPDWNVLIQTCSELNRLLRMPHSPEKMREIYEQILAELGPTFKDKLDVAVMKVEVLNCVPNLNLEQFISVATKQLVKKARDDLLASCKAGRALAAKPDAVKTTLTED